MSSLGRALLVANPAAKHGVTGSLIPVIRNLLRGVADFDVEISSEPAHALEIAREARGHDTIVAVGGDGTAHEVVNGIMSRPAEDRPVFAVIPTGSGNDYARTLGVSFDVPTAVGQIAHGRRRRIDLGVCNGVWFANSIALGLDGRVTAKAVDLKATTDWSGLPLYVRALLFVMLRQYYAQEVRIVTDDSAPVSLSILGLTAAIGPTYGGGFRITPDARIDDGLLDICRIDPMPLPMAFARLPFVIAGKHTNMSVVHMSRVKTMRIESDIPLAGQIDGEVMRERSYLVRCVPLALEVLVPGDGIGS